MYFGDLHYGVEGGLCVDFHLGVGPPWDFYHSMKSLLLWVTHQGDVVEGGDGAFAVPEEHLVGVGVGLAPLQGSVGGHRHPEDWTTVVQSSET